jgi:succinyl-CoA synthetase alpha subunit
MSILINKNTKVITQGMTGKVGQFHTHHCKQYANGANCFVAGVNPKKAGEDFEGIPVYASVLDAKKATARRVRDLFLQALQQPSTSGGSRSGSGDHYRGRAST